MSPSAAPVADILCRDVCFPKGSDLELSTSVLWIAVTAALALIATCILSLRQAAILRRLRRRERLYRLLFEQSKDVVGISTPEGKLLDINQAGVELYGYDSKEEMLSLDTRELYFEPKHREGVVEQLESLGYLRGYEVHHKTKTGELLIVQGTTSTLRDKRGNVEYQLTILRDVTEQKRAEERLVHMARFDSLTGLPNRYTFRDSLEAAVARVRRFGRRMAVMVFDLADLAQINETRGRGAGDALLVAAARRLESNVRKVDTLARLGGERFAVLKSDFVDRRDAELLARRLLDDLEKPFRVEGEEVQTSIAAGIALFPSGSGDADELLDRADQALWRAKADGPGSVRFFESPPGPEGPGYEGQAR